MKRRRLKGLSIAVLAAMAAAASLTACGKQAAPTAVEPAPQSVRLSVAERVVEPATTEIAGSVSAEKVTAVSSRVMALVSAVHVQLGDPVRAGQVLVSIDATAAQGQVAQAQGALAQAQAALALAERNFARFQSLAATGSASELELDMARMQDAQARGAVQQAQGAVDAASSVARESQVVAPFAGRVTQRLVEVGDLAAPGRPLVMLESATGRRLALAIPEGLAHAAALKVGDRLAVTLDALPGTAPIAGEVVEISPGADPVTHSYTVKLALPGEVPSGSAARAAVPTGERELVLVPREARVESGGLTLVVVRDAEGRAQTRVVTLGRSRPDGRIEVLSGLAGGESVALGLPSAPAAGTRLEEVRP